MPHPGNDDLGLDKLGRAPDGGAPAEAHELPAPVHAVRRRVEAARAYSIGHARSADKVHVPVTSRPDAILGRSRAKCKI